jgi:hypothetical protein
VWRCGSNRFLSGRVSTGRSSECFTKCSKRMYLADTDESELFITD